MIVVFRGKAEVEDMLAKVNKMYKFSKELKDCLEDKVEEGEYEEYDDDDEVSYRGNYRSRDAQYRKGGGRYGYRRM